MRHWAALFFALLLGAFFCYEVGKNPPQTPSDSTLKSKAASTTTVMACGTSPFGCNPPQTP